jgi:hypothetical protein
VLALGAASALAACAAAPEEPDAGARELQSPPAEPDPSDPERGRETSDQRAGRDADSEWRRAVSLDGQWELRWRPDPAPLPMNEPFALDVEVAPAAGAKGDQAGRAAPGAGTELFVSAWMPEHGHGMLRAPRARPQAPPHPSGSGRFRVRGMLLHMGGRWQLFFDVVRGGIASRVEFELVL